MDDLRKAGALDDGNNPIVDPSRGLKTIEQGAATSIWCALSPQLDGMGGLYCEDCHVAELQENPDARSGVRGYALDPEHAKALWAKSEEMVGERF